MTELETAMGMIIDVFARYSGAEGNKQSLTKGELRALMERELPGFLQVRARALRDRAGAPPGQGQLGPRTRGAAGQAVGRRTKTGMEGRRDRRGQDPTALKWRGGVERK